ncbi:LysE family translocator [Arenibacterium halophilum]|uniref:LysE family translocator n=1 Tax=Arenibacterium halophilum TaxID=2583821 RepID=A0ABY2X5F1_9RHOB|nr:LysE family translocator [Arenibacterium halophilum]TMV10670.1 LysE family translocator [Arenibacterium halophilum]
MTIGFVDLALYAGALLALFLTPGPVWLALVARTVSGGFAGAWPLALGVVVGDMMWPFIAIMGVSWLVQEVTWLMSLLRWVAAAIFLVMGVMLVRNADRPIATDARLTRPGRLAGFAAGVAVILGNPKAILFYMSVLPGFFDLRRISGMDIAVIVGLSALMPLVGNLFFALVIDKMRRFIASPGGVRRLNLVSGGLLIVVGVLIPLL